MGVQVQTATKDGQGKSLSILNRQFISFKYGGKNIEDFDLLVIFNGDRLNKEIYAPFKDTTTEQAELDGQLFWRTNFNAGQLNFTLATDGITSQQLEDFKNWFKPGIEKELILSENHNRGILARVSAAPQMSLLPFEKEVEINIAGILKKTKTSLYKGEISLSFIMDDPYWYSLEPYLEEIQIEDMPEYKENLNENELEKLQEQCSILNKENYKILYEDGTPYLSMLKAECLLADNLSCFKNKENNYVVGANQGIELAGSPQQKDAYLYYCGTAPAKPIISFDIEPVIDDGTGKISFPNEDENKIIYLSIGVGEDYKKLKFGLPSLFSSYNNALDIALKYKKDSSILDLRKELRDFVYDYYTRSYVIALIDIVKNDEERKYADVNGKIKEGFQNYFIGEMKNFFTGSLSCVINCKNGSVTITGKIRQYDGSKMVEIKEPITENAGNMIKSDYLTIDTRILPKEGKITVNECLFIETNSKLSNFTIDYKYMYL